jgi:hypothetical protein
MNRYGLLGQVRLTYLVIMCSTPVRKNAHACYVVSCVRSEVLRLFFPIW